MFELLCREFGNGTGVFFATLDEAVEEAQPGDEVWQVADDVQRTRVCKMWPPQGQGATHGYGGALMEGGF